MSRDNRYVFDTNVIVSALLFNDSDPVARSLTRPNMATRLPLSILAQGVVGVVPNRIRA